MLKWNELHIEPEIFIWFLIAFGDENSVHVTFKVVHGTDMYIFVWFYGELCKLYTDNESL